MTKADQMYALIDARAATGKTVVDYCAEVGISRAKYNYWQLKRKRSAAPPDEPAFVFLNKRRDRIKLLVWDRNGFVVWHKVLERGTFELPAAETDQLEMSWTDIQLLLEGIEIKSAKRRKRYRRVT